MVVEVDKTPRPLWSSQEVRHSGNAEELRNHEARPQGTEPGAGREGHNDEEGQSWNFLEESESKLTEKLNPQGG